MEIIGAVVDVEFPRDSIPQVHEALMIDEASLTLEVQQQLGDGIVRTIAMGSSEGLKRGMSVTAMGGPATEWFNYEDWADLDAEPNLLATSGSDGVIRSDPQSFLTGAADYLDQATEAAYYPAKAWYLRGMFYAEQGQIRYARESYEGYLKAASPLDPYREEVRGRLEELKRFEER